MPSAHTTERERKFLIPILPPRLSIHPHYLIRQGYLVIAEDGSEARLRRLTHGRRHQHFLTIKRPTSSPAARTEVEIPLPQKHFTQLWPLTKHQRLEKTRYHIPLPPGLTIELDVYHGPLRGLAVAEVEFPSPRHARSFHPPPWFGPDVTNIPSLRNQSLAHHGLPKTLLKRLHPG